MRVTDIRLENLPDGGGELSAQVSVEHPRPKTYRIWFRGPRKGFGDGPLGDVFLAALLMPAMFLHEELEIDGEVSRELHDAAYGRLEPLFLKWHPKYLKASPLRGARIVESLPPPAAGVGCMFSGGIDSTFSYSRRLDEITHLVFLGGFEMPWKRDDLREGALVHLGGLSRALDREVVVLYSNLQQLVDDIAKWSAELGRWAPGFLLVFYFGSMLVSFNLCLRGILGRAIIPSSWSHDNAVTWGSHPDLEPNWSTSALTVELDGAETPRIDKIAWILEHAPQRFQHLRVCPRPNGGAYINCGGCSKCLRTMMEMRVAGVPASGFSTFEKSLDLRKVRRSFHGGDGGLTEELLDRARAAGDSEVARSVEILLGQRFHLPRVLEGVRLKIKAVRKARRKRRHSARRSRRAAAKD